jgi:acyl carrier protein
MVCELFGPDSSTIILGNQIDHFRRTITGDDAMGISRLDTTSTVVSVLSYSSGISASLLSESTPLAELALDSVSYVSTIAVLEAELDRDFSPEVVEAILAAVTVGDIVKILEPSSQG